MLSAKFLLHQCNGGISDSIQWLHSYCHLNHRFEISAEFHACSRLPLKQCWEENRPISRCIKFFGLLSHPQPTRLSPKRFSPVWSTKKHLEGKHFADDDVQHEVLLWMRQQPKEFYAAGIGALMKRWDKCINIGGDYVEK
ncbi:hypothetical protein AVEN_141168-1 [Araneus ventricosus]|uniref:Uncharacterized protein n=1 Tax=Araneus ventricosus TaxID=182803 RepID=A0A4Y2E1L8_ARAVE|nr:hypothetical protein AVEN_136517-1 [Araneus ventricosus]GBM24267.1 hypothetical protein AVEN_141168-1 [Araneus ventricosus]